MSDMYQIRVKGHLDRQWSGWFDGMLISNEASGEAVLSGMVIDQAALCGLLVKIRDLGLPLMALNHLSNRVAPSRGASAGPAVERGASTAVTLEDNKRIARRFLELVDAEAVEELCTMIAPTWTMYGGPPNLPMGPAGIYELFRAIGPIDQRWMVDDVIAEDDKVVVRATNSCSQASFFGIEGHGTWQTFTATFIHRIVGGKILTTWRNADDLGRLFQLGAHIVPGATS